MRISSFAILGIFLGASAGVGIFLIVSRWLWPRQGNGTRLHTPTRMSEKLSTAALQLGIKPGVLVSLTVVLGCVGSAVGWALTGVIALSLVCALAAAGIPWMVAAAKATSARRVLRNQWPDVVDALISAIRSGANVPDAVMSLSSFSSAAISVPASHFVQDYRATGNFTLAANDLKTRWANPNGDRIIETLRLGREVGGSDITTVLSALGSHLRIESALRQEVEARQGWIRLAARIGVAAPWIVLVLLSTRPEATSAYNSGAGLVVIAVGFVVSICAYKIMSAVGYLPEEKRWLA